MTASGRPALQMAKMEDHGFPAFIRAAGGLVWRSSTARKQIAIIHRPHYGDWTLPKGKLDPNEDWRQAAKREVEEETGFRVQVAEFAGAVSYPVKQAAKVVLFWNMFPLGEPEFRPNDEADQLQWLSVDAAVKKLSYPSEQAFLIGLSGRNAL